MDSPSTQAAASAAVDDQSVEDLTAELVVVSGRLTRTLRRLAREETDPSTVRALSVVDELQPVRVGRFAAEHLCSQPAATKLLARLEADGLVVRRSSGADRRAAEFSLTEDGRRRLVSIRGQLTEQLAPALRDLDAGDRAGLARSLASVEEFISSVRPDDDARR